jgi:exopolysaccharide biosynthesis polyprenyl glycosylphosphotransferase
MLGVADMWAAGLTLVITCTVLGNHNLTWATLAVPPLFLLGCKAVGLYERDEHLLHKNTLDEIPALAAIATVSALLLYLSDGLLVEGALVRTQILEAWALLFLFVICLRSFARWAAHRLAPSERCLLLGDANLAEKLRELLAVSRSVRAELVGVLPTNGASANGDLTSPSPHPNLGWMLAEHQIDRVIVTTGPGLGRDDVLYVIKHLKSYGVKVSVLPEASRVAGSSVELDQLSGLTLLGVRGFEITGSSRLIKRCMDVAGSAIALIALTPILTAIALLVKFDSPGPVLFRQLRAGRGGRPFEMLKFRSMVDGADGQKDGLRHLNEADGVFKIALDPRITRVGRWLRHMHLDELPQLLNVLRGEMSLVGPRPLPLDEDRAIQGWYRDRLEVRPGITGYWQVLGSARIPAKEMVKLDYLYVANWSLWSDVKLLLRTVPVVLRRRGL